MRIVVDLQACQSGSRLGGIGRYSLNLAQALALQCERRGHELHVVLNDLMPEAIPGIYRQLAGYLPRRRIQVFQVPGPVAENLPANQARARAAELIRECFIHSLDPDIVHVASLIEGLGDDVVSSVGRLVPGDATSVTLYDLIPLVEKQDYLTDPIVSAHYHRKLADLRRTGGLLAISAHSRDEAVRELGINPDIITNIAAGVDEKFRPRDIPPEEAQAVMRSHGIERPFLLFAGSFDVRKNHARLIEAYARLPHPLRAAHQLVIIGNGWPGVYDQLRAHATRHGLAEGELVFTGRVPDDDLLTLYNLSKLFVFPSLSEGYGLPALEAMACGIPTIGSNTTSIPEVIGRADALFDPRDVGSMAQKIVQALSDADFRRRLREHGLHHSRGFTWERTARIALDAFEQQHRRMTSTARPAAPAVQDRCVALLRDTLMERQTLSGEVVRIAAALAANRRCLSPNPAAAPHIGWITTWNTRCGIAMYAKYLAGAHVSDYTILAPFEEHPDRADESTVERCWHMDGKDLRLLADTIHARAIDTLVIQFQYGFFDFPAFARFLQEMIATGRRVYIVLHATSDTPTKKLAELAPQLALCDAVLVHSPNDESALAGLGLAANVERFPHGVVDLPPATIARPAPAGRFIIASYGFFLPHKGLPELIDACALLTQQHGLDVHLLMINAEYPVELSRQLVANAHERIAAAGLRDRVTLVSDFLPDERSLGYLQHADLVIYPYQQTGESSSAAVRMGLAAGRPVAVTPLRIFDDVANNVFILPATDAAAIARGVAELAARLRSDDNDAEVLRVRDNAARWVETHRYSRIAESLWKRLTAEDTAVDAAGNALTA